MKEKLKYFIINKGSDHARGVYEDMRIDGSTLVAVPKSNSGVGRYLTRVFDSGESMMVWHRLIINASNCVSADFKITVYSTNDLVFSHEGRNTDVSEVIHDENMNLTQKLELLAPFEKKRISGTWDILLHDVEGRYIWVFIELYCFGNDASPVIEDIRLYLPASSWIDHMPAIYRNNDGDTHFLERYLGIFQTFHEELEQEIQDIINKLDPECAEGAFLNWLSGWLSISDSSKWEEEKLRKLLMKAVDLYRRRGTRQSLSELIELYTGEKPYIIEGGVLKERFGADNYEKKLARLYGSDPYVITVIVNKCDKPDVVRQLALEMIPVTSELNFVVLEPYIFLGKYSYLGVNSRLNLYREARLDGKSPLELSAIGRKNDNKLSAAEIDDTAEFIQENEQSVHEKTNGELAVGTERENEPSAHMEYEDDEADHDVQENEQTTDADRTE